MNLVLFGTAADRSELERSFSALPEWCYRRICIYDYRDYDSYIAGLREGSPDCVVVMMNGAAGMEGVIAAKNSGNRAPVLWFSDDNCFGAQSYRLGCVYFHTKPLSPQVLSDGMAKLS